MALRTSNIFSLIKENLITDLDNLVFTIEKSLTAKRQNIVTICPESKITLRKVLSKMKQKWKEAHYMVVRFNEKNRQWLDDFTTLMVITAVYWINVLMIFTVISAHGYVFYLFLIVRISFNSSEKPANYVKVKISLLMSDM